MMKFLKYTAYVLVLIGALNWGVIGLFGFNPVSALFGDLTILTRIIYAVIGVSAVITALTMHQCKIIEEIDTCGCGNCKF